MASSSKDPSNIEEGLRFYVGRFPWKVAPLLAEAKRVFCKTPGGTQSGGAQRDRDQEGQEEGEAQGQEGQKTEEAQSKEAQKN